MQLIVDIQNKFIAEKILAILNVFKSDGVKIKTIDTQQAKQQNAHEYDVDYEKSFQYKLDRADFLEMKEAL